MDEATYYCESEAKESANENNMDKETYVHLNHNYNKHELKI